MSRFTTGLSKNFIRNQSFLSEDKLITKMVDEAEDQNRLTGAVSSSGKLLAQSFVREPTRLRLIMKLI